MRPVKSTWSEVTKGDYIQDPNGRVWKIVEFDFEEHKIRLRDRTGKDLAILPRRPNEPVTKLVMTEAEVAKIVKRELGAEFIAEQTPKGWRVPRFPNRFGPAAKAHLFMMHGIYTEDVKTYAGLKEAHDESHANPDPHFVNAHTHPA